MCQPSTPDCRNSREKPDLDRDAFLAVVTHELRTPTTAILGWATLIGEGGVDEETLAHAVKAIERNARLQEQLIEQLLDFSRVNQGCLKLDARRVALVPILEAAVDTMMPLSKLKKIDLQASLDASTGAVIGDPFRLQQVVTNLLGNAIKFTPSGGRIDIRLARHGSHAEITVSDTGRGIRPEFLPYIFDPFRQAGEDRPTAHDGLGLGLAIARHIVEGHDGKIYAYSLGEGKGTTFTVSLPLEDVAAATNLRA
jgi:signal transduction histidine kinase